MQFHFFTYDTQQYGIYTRVPYYSEYVVSADAGVFNWKLTLLTYVPVVRESKCVVQSEECVLQEQ